MLSPHILFRTPIHTTSTQGKQLIRAMPICEGMPWNYTLFPNLREHESQEEANLELEQFRQLIELHCSGAIVHIVYFSLPTSYLFVDSF